MGAESKQVKVDNWGIFFLQRLQTFFNKTYFCDLTLQFDDNVQLKVHRLVMNACTEYFQVLEQTCEIINDCLIMPPDLQADVVVPIVNFMYTGILEFQISIFDRLYSTARLMNMTVLTKLLDAQKIPISPITKPINKRSPISPITWNLQGKRIAPKTMDPDLPETLPGRKLPIWKRKSVPTSTYRNDMICGLPDPISNKYFRSNIDEVPKPTRFEWPDDEDTNFDTNSFDEISYTSKPMMIPQREKSPKPSTSSNNFEELKRSSISVKRPGSPIYNDNKKVNIQDVKEYMKEQKIRSDYIEYDDSEAADNDLQTYENNDSDDDGNKDDVFDQNNEDGPNKSILKHDASTPHNKRVRFSLEGKENAAKITQKTSSTAATIKTNATSVDMTNHTKIITEVLKKYPHLVKKNKNIRLKILAKNTIKPMGTPVKVAKPAVKVNYMVMKPGENKTATSDSKKDGHWSCHKCSNPNPLQFETYYLYRKHLTEVHNEKTDSQMCNICGHISRKQNMLVYHKFIKHNITPPPSYHFPECKDCPYIALSPALLTKHQLNQAHHNLVCTECNTTFQTKSALISHIHLTGHNDKNNCPTYDCTYCAKKFISDETLFQHIKNNHKIEAKRDKILSQEEEETPDERKENIITAEEIDAMDDSSRQQEIEQTVEKPKEKIKILSDVKVITPLKRKLQPVKIIPSEPEPTEVVDSQPLEPSSEAESLSNVASGIAASLGLVNTIVVLDDNQFILQSQDGIQENIISTNQQNIILPDVGNMNNIQNLVSQHQVITSDSQIELNKNNITSTDELVMVLTDHDYSDASNNTVITSEKSNIVFLYSHPVQNQDGQFLTQPGNVMMNSEMGLVEVSNNFVANSVPIEEKQCEESIELIQQEINNHLETESQEKIVEEQIVADEISEQEQEQEHNENSESEKIEIGELETEEDQQHLKEEHQHVTEEQHITEEYQQQITDEHQQQITEEHLQNMTDEHQDTIEFDQGNETEVTLEETEEINKDCETQSISDEIQQISDEINSPGEEMESPKGIEPVPEEIQRSERMQLISEDIHNVSEDIPHVSEDIHHVSEDIQQVSDDMQPISGEMQPSEEEMQHSETSEQFSEQMVQISEEMRSVSVQTAQNDLLPENDGDNHFEEPMEIEESIEMIQQEIRRSSTELQENSRKKSESEDIPPCRSPEKILSESNDEKGFSNNQEDAEPVPETHELREAISNEEQDTELTNENQQMTNEDEEIEHMEVDSSKLIHDENKIENIQNKLISDGIIPDSEEEKSQTVINEHQMKSENILSSENHQIKEETIENIKKEIQSVPEENLDTNIETTENQTQETVEPTNEENTETEKTNESMLSPDLNQETEEPKTAVQSSITVTKDPSLTNSKISNLLDDWDDGDTDSQTSDPPKQMPVTDNASSINTLINDWEDEEET